LTYDAVVNEDTFGMDEVYDTYAVGGVDLSATTDLTCATLLIMKPNDNTIYQLQKYFIPKEVMTRRVKEDKVPYDLWEKQGYVQACEGSTIKYSDITAWFVEMREVHQILPLWIGYDPWNAKYWVDDMENNGFNMCVVRQGFQTLSEPMKQMGGDLSDNLVNYNNNPVFKWCLINTSAKTDENNNIKPVKGVSQTLRIDGMVSSLCAFVMLSENKNDYLNMI